MSVLDGMVDPERRDEHHQILRRRSNRPKQGRNKVNPPLMNSGVYILHFDEDIDYNHVDNYGDKRHYIGCSKNISKRVMTHMEGTGAKFTKQAYKQKAVMKLAAIFPGELWSMEQFLTRYGPRKLCPICISKDDSRIVRDRASGHAKKSYPTGL